MVLTTTIRAMGDDDDDGGVFLDIRRDSCDAGAGGTVATETVEIRSA